MKPEEVKVGYIIQFYNGDLFEVLAIDYEERCFKVKQYLGPSWERPCEMDFGDVFKVFIPHEFIYEI